MHILASTSVPFRPTTVQMPNLAQIEMKGLYSVRKADYRTVLLIPDLKNPFARSNPDVMED